MVNRKRNTIFARSAGFVLATVCFAACGAAEDVSDQDALGDGAPATATMTATATQTPTTTAPAASPTPNPSPPAPTATVTETAALPTTTAPTPQEMTSTSMTATAPTVAPTASDLPGATPTAPPTQPAPMGSDEAMGGSDDAGDDMAPTDPPDPAEMTEDMTEDGAGGAMDPGDDMMTDPPGDMPADGTQYGGGAARKLGYLGCSMSQNVAEGYASLGGEYLWPVMGAYGAQVVQNWTSDGGSPWSGDGSFDSAVEQYGTPDAVWVMLCIFSNMVTIDESKQIVDLVRMHAPGAKIFITGQPLNSGTDCFLAGDGGAALTDRIAQETPMQAGYEDVVYAGTFGPLTPEQRSDGCHANADGMRLLGEQVIEKWGK